MSGDSSLVNQNVKLIIERLFRSEIDRLNKISESIIIKNHILTSNGYFFYQDVYYISETAHRTIKKHAGKKHAGRLANSLIPTMESYLKDKRKVDYDIGRVTQAISMVLLLCKNLQDMRDTLPNCMVDLIPEISQLPRTREEGFNLLDVPRKYKQYMKIKPLIEFYSTVRLFY